MELELAEENSSEFRIKDERAYCKAIDISREWSESLEKEQWHDRGCPHPEILVESDTFEPKKPKGMLVWVYRNSESDSTSGGISSKYNRLVLCSTNLPQQIPAQKNFQHWS